MRPDRRIDDFNAFPERDGELTLPDDLAAMAEQLADDAQRLSACYPPQFGPVSDVMAAVASASPRRSSRPALWLVTSIAGGVVAIGLLILLALQINHQLPADRHAAPTSDNDAQLAGTHLVSEPIPELSARDMIEPAVSPGYVPPLTPASWERGVTGAEMEALMDLRRIDELAIDTESLEF